MSRLNLWACLACLVASGGVACGGDTVTYAVTDRGLFGILDLSTGDFTAYGDVAVHGYTGLGNLGDGTLVGIAGHENVVTIDPNSGTMTPVGRTGVRISVSASLLTGEQYAIDQTNQLYQIDPDTGAATLIGSTGIPGIDTAAFFANALAGDDAYNLYYVYEQTGRNPVPSTLFQLDLTTGAATAIGPTGVTGIGGAGFANGTLYAYGGSANGQSIYTIDVSSGTATDTGVKYSTAIQIYGSNSGGAP